MKMNALWCAVVAGWCCASAAMAAVELKQDDAAGRVILCNEVVSLAFNMSKGTYEITDKATGQLMVDLAGLSADSYGNADSMKFTWTQEEAKDALGAGKRLVVAMEHTKPRAVPVYLFTFTVYAYDFWSDTLVGRFPGTAKVERQLGPTHCAMLSIRKVQQNPQVLSTNRHVLQGWVDLANVKWDGKGKCLSGVARVIGGEPFKIVVAGNGSTATKVTAAGAQAKLEKHPADGLAQIILERPENGDVSWQVTY